MNYLKKAGLILPLILGSCTWACSGSGTSGENKPEPEPPVPPAQSWDVGFWLTNADKTALFSKQNASFRFEANSPLITVDDSERYQEMDGFGYTLTGGSALHLYNMTAAERARLLKELFATDGNNIGVSYLRLSIGASDLDENVFSYNDLPANETDPELKKFSIDRDKRYLLPVLKEILAISPDIKLLGSPWSPPVWMKTNGSSKGGSLKPEYYDAYAQYFVKYIEAMKKEGITIDAITVQNEPLHPGNNPSLLMPANEQAAFIKKSLGPAFKKAGLKTKIIIYDHNADKPEYPIEVLNDKEAAAYIDGSAFHLYGGTIENISKVHKAHPDKNLYFTEQWIGAPGNFAENLKWHIKELIVGAPRNWCRNVLEWNLAADEHSKPHTDGGCTECLGALTISNDKVVRNPAYYIIAHASKFVRPGAVRIKSDANSGLPNVAFKNKDGKLVLIVLNNNNNHQTFNIKFKDKIATFKLDAGAVGTFTW